MPDETQDTHEQARTQLCIDVLNISQTVYGFLSPLQHMMALSAAINQIAYTIELEAQKIVTENDAHDFFQQAAARSGTDIQVSAINHPVLEWNIDHTATPPNCIHCTDRTLEIDKIYEEIAYAHCSNCDTKHIINLSGGKLSND